MSVSSTTASKSAPPSPPTRFGLGQFVIPLGVSGLAGAWTAASATIGAAAWVAEVLWITCALLWGAFSIVYAWERLGHPAAFTRDLRHPIFGPFAANIPLIGMLLATHFGPYLPDAAPWLVWIFVWSSLLVAAQLLTHWISGGLDLDFLHPGYFLPVIAAAFVGSVALSSIGMHDAAVAAFATGTFFWLTIGTIVTGRLITGGPLMTAIKPTLSVLLVPPAVGGVAWLALQRGTPDAVGFGFVGVLCILLLVHLMLIRQYARLPVSISLWTFSFPIAAATNFGLRWMAASPFPGSVPTSWSILGLATLAIIGIATLMLVPPTKNLRRMVSRNDRTPQ